MDDRAGQINTTRRRPGNSAAQRYYAGIGSRRTPEAVLPMMTAIARDLAARGWTLRSGGAPGADVAFEAGAGDAKEIYLPWPGFNGNPSPLCEPTATAFAVAERFHPAWHKCSTSSRQLHARNCHQVLGRDLQTPVDFVVCWTPEGSGAGGTGQAIRIAHALRIPVFDLGRGDEVSAELRTFLAQRF